jgi:hypothetical protein
MGIGIISFRCMAQFINSGKLVWGFMVSVFGHGRFLIVMGAFLQCWGITISMGDWC